LGKWLLANNMGSIMHWKILAGASTLAIVFVVASAGLASAQGCYGGCYPDYAYRPGYAYAPGPFYDYYRAYDSIPWNYRGGPHPR
jgi:hypothetical protein